MAAGKFITFEGGEGSGKSTQARLLAERLRAAGHGVVETREPGGSPFAERLRGILLDPATEPHGPLSEVLLFYAARADHLERKIRPALAEGSWVICDRFSDSTRVYQGLAGQINPKVIEALELIVVTPTRPDLTIIIDVAVEIGLARAEVRRAEAALAAPGPRRISDLAGRSARPLMADRYESKDVDFHRRLREGFLTIAREEPQRCVVVDGQASVGAISDKVWEACTSRLKVGS